MYIMPTLLLDKIVDGNLILTKLNIYILRLVKIYNNFNIVSVKLLTNRNFYATILKIK